MAVYDFCEAWPDDLKELSRQAYRAACRVENLQGAIPRVEPREFGTLMDELERAIADCREVTLRFRKAKLDWDTQNLTTWGHHA